MGRRLQDQRLGSWYKITAVGKSVSSLYGERGHAATGLFRVASTSGYKEGIDVSHRRRARSTAKVKAAGKTFVFAKATEGNGLGDRYMDRNKAGAIAQGLKFGAYHQVRPGLNNPIAEADWFVQEMDLERGMLLPVLDLEVTGGLGPTASPTGRRPGPARLRAHRRQGGHLHQPVVLAERPQRQSLVRRQRLRDPVGRPLGRGLEPVRPREQLGRLILDVLAVHEQRDGPGDLRRSTSTATASRRSTPSRTDGQPRCAGFASVRTRSGGRTARPLSVPAVGWTAALRNWRVPALGGATDAVGATAAAFDPLRMRTRPPCAWRIRTTVSTSSGSNRPARTKSSIGS